jgi:hypothetical protein
MSDQTKVDFRPNPDGTPNSWLCNHCEESGSFNAMVDHIRTGVHTLNVQGSFKDLNWMERANKAELTCEASGILIAQLQQENAELSRHIEISIVARAIHEERAEKAEQALAEERTRLDWLRELLSKQIAIQFLSGPEVVCVEIVDCDGTETAFARESFDAAIDAARSAGEPK